MKDKKGKKEVNTSMKLDEELWGRWKILCFKEGKTITEYVTELIVNEIKRKENEA